MDKITNANGVSSNGSAAAELVAEQEEALFLQAQEIISGFVVSMMVKAANELGLLDALSDAAAAGGGLTALELAEQLPAAADKAVAAASVERMLRYLASFDVVRYSAELGPDGEALLRYSPAPVCRWLTGNHKQGSLAPLAKLLHDEDYMTTWHHVAAAVAGGTPAAFERAHGLPIFEYMGRNPRLNSLFNQAMAQQSVLVTDKMLERFDRFAGVGVLVDVGGGTGAILEKITSRYKQIRGVNFDLPHVIAEAPSRPGVKHIAGNMFHNVPKGDAIILKWILHDHNDEDCIKILKNCHQSLADNGKVIIVEIVLPTTPQVTPASKNSFLLDVVMFDTFHGGKERTESEFTKLAKNSGFCGAFRSSYIFGNFWALEFTK